KLVERPGWEVAQGGVDGATADIAGLGKASVPVFRTSMVGPTAIDLLAPYTPSAQGIHSADEFASLIRDAVNGANRVFANSDTGVRFDLVGTPVVGDTSLAPDEDFAALVNPHD